MLDEKTTERLVELGVILGTAGDELKQLINELADAADRQMAAAARAFLAEYDTTDCNAYRFHYRAAHEALLTASIAAGNLHETRQRAQTFAGKCGWWTTALRELRGGRNGQMERDVKLVLDKMLKARAVVT